MSQAYWSVLGGAAGHVFGNNPIWLLDPGWENAFASPGSVAMSVLRDLMDSRPWFELVPDYYREIVTAGRSLLYELDYAAAASTPDGNLLIVWVPTARNDLTVDLSKLSGESVDVWRFDPTDGTASLDGSYPTIGPRVFSSSGLEVLVFDNAALGRTAPGSRP